MCADSRSVTSPVIRALRFAGEEVQLGAVLASICQQPEVAAAFVDAVITQTKNGNPAARRRAKRSHGEVSCLGEQQLGARLTRRLSRDRARDLGRVDLRFRGSGAWSLSVELKLNSGFGHKQLERYTQSGLVAAIVRDAAAVPTLRDNPNWVGAASWSWLVDDLKHLPIDSHWAAQWSALIDVLESDGDFDVKAPTSKEVVAQTALFEALGSAVLDRFCMELERTYGASAQPAISGLKQTRTYKGAMWTGLGIDGADGPWLWIAIRNLFGPAPRLSVDYYPFPDWRARRRLEAAHTKIESTLGFAVHEDFYRFDQPMTQLSNATPDDALSVITELLITLVASGVFALEIERLAPRRRRHATNRPQSRH
jgi:hypothetical protein